MFQQAETLHMTAAKLATGRDMPISGMEMALWNTYYKVKTRLEHQQHGRGGKSKRR